MESASRRYPSFSSTLLDEIYRSIDEEEEEEESIPSRTKSRNACFEDDDERLRRACLVQEWIENKAAAAAAASTTRGSLNLNIKPKPIRTCVYQHDKQQRIVYGQAAYSQTKSKFTKTKSKALKILKHPISPGGRLATFLNSLFTNNKPNSRKSSASPSCLTNITPSSTNGFNPQNNQENKLNLKYDNNNISENLFKNYQNKVEKESDDGGSSSDSSSDLFELHNISAPHMYRDELPIYETTQLDTNPLFI
ncbi:putative protein BIG GRAIN 1 [Helianthus debilis subsp. tardiflorus]